jgi:hypothetical protein
VRQSGRMTTAAVIDVEHVARLTQWLLSRCGGLRQPSPGRTSRFFGLRPVEVVAGLVPGGWHCVPIVESARVRAVQDADDVGPDAERGQAVSGSTGRSDVDLELEYRRASSQELALADRGHLHTFASAALSSTHGPHLDWI